VSNADRLVEGAVDIHVHFAPDPRVERRADAIEIAQQAASMGMQGLVFKSHEYPTHPVAYTVNQIVRDITLIGGVALDWEVGGLNPAAVEASANMGGRVVWMPTYSAQADRQHKGLSGGICLLDDQGTLLAEVYSVLELIKAHDMVLATGHISTRECMVLVSEAKNMGVNRVVVTHGTTSAFWTGMTAEDMKTLAGMGAFVEHCIHVMMPMTYRMPPEELVDVSRLSALKTASSAPTLARTFTPCPPKACAWGLPLCSRPGWTKLKWA